MRTTAQIAKDIRTDIKAAVKAGDLPADLTYSVRSETGSIDVTIKGLTNAFIYGEDHNPMVDGRIYTAEAKALLVAVRDIRAAYNRTSGDPYADYGVTKTFYGSVSIDDERDAAFEAREKATAAARRAAR